MVYKWFKYVCQTVFRIRNDGLLWGHLGLIYFDCQLILFIDRWNEHAGPYRGEWEITKINSRDLYHGFYNETQFLRLTRIMEGTTRLNHQIYKLNNIFLNWDNLSNLSLPLGPYIMDKNYITEKFKRK